MKSILKILAASLMIMSLTSAKAEIDQEAEVGEIPEGANFIKENK